MRGSKIGIVFNEPLPSGQTFCEASRDVLVQVEGIERVLRKSGHRPVRIPFTRDLNRFVRRLQDEEVALAFNLCETVDEDARLAGHPAAVLELLGVPFTGSPAIALMVTTDKLITKRLLAASGIRTARGRVCDGLASFSPAGLGFPVIIKPRFEDASIGIDQDSIFVDASGLEEGIEALSARFGSLLVEEYIDGREFNISVYGYPAARVLAAAEIDFARFPENLYPIVGYRAKWDKDSFEYHHTPRVFPQDIPPTLLAEMERTALECFRLFTLRDYGRIDMRVDRRGWIHVLEVNANPCLSPDAGFAAAAENSGMSYSRMVRELADFAMKRATRDDHQADHLSGPGSPVEAAQAKRSV